MGRIAMNISKEFLIDRHGFSCDESSLKATYRLKKTNKKGKDLYIIIETNNDGTYDMNVSDSQFKSVFFANIEKQVEFSECWNFLKL